MSDYFRNGFPGTGYRRIDEFYRIRERTTVENVADALRERWGSLYVVSTAGGCNPGMLGEYEFWTWTSVYDPETNVLTCLFRRSEDAATFRLLWPSSATGWG